MAQRFTPPAVLIAVFAIAMGSGIDALVKAIAPNAGLHHLIAWRFLFGGLIALAVFRAQKRPFPSTEAIRFHTGRGLIQLACAFTFFFALIHLPLAVATIIGFTAALMVPFVARLLLHEKITPVALIATGIGFLGAVLAIIGRPQNGAASELWMLGVASCFLSAFLYALGLVLLRMRATHEDATTIAMFTNVVPALAMLPVTIGLFGQPDWNDIPLFLMFGVLGFATWYLMTVAYARAPARRLAPLEYSALIWSGLFGSVFFQEYPGWQTWVGALIIIGACLIVAFEERFTTRKETGMPVSDLPE
ncbi:MAG: DMT family transporter [Hyphomonadaceae bacterium]|nr:DMT family transporter [Hyphomonadaceae bacterium]